METDEAVLLDPGDKIVFVPPGKQKTGSGMQESPCHTPTTGMVFTGQEYIVSYLQGYNEKNKLVFKHLVKDEPEFAKNENIASVQIYLDNFDDPINISFFQKERPEHLKVGEYSIDSYVQALEEDLIPANEFLVEMVDENSLYNLYYVELQDYYFYLDLGIKRGKRTDINIVERAMSAYKQKAEELKKDPGEINLEVLYNSFLQRQNEKKNFFLGTKNICELLEKEYGATYYGEIIELLRNRRIQPTTINTFYENLWLSKKEFQMAVLLGYHELYSPKSFEKYKW